MYQASFDDNLVIKKGINHGLETRRDAGDDNATVAASMRLIANMTNCHKSCVPCHSTRRACGRRTLQYT